MDIRKILRRPTIYALALISLVTAILALATTAAAPPANATHVPLTEVAIDMDVAGNADNSLGPTEFCNATPLAVGDTIDIDVVVRGVPPYDPSVVITRPDGTVTSGADGIAGFAFNLIFDPGVLQVNSVHGYGGPTILKAGGVPYPFTIIDYDWGDGLGPSAAPGTIGDVRVDVGDLSHHVENGDGILTRITLQAVGQGISGLFLDEYVNGGINGSVPTVLDVSSDYYGFDTIGNASLMVGGSNCPPAPLSGPTSDIDVSISGFTASGTGGWLRITVDASVYNGGPHQADVVLNIAVVSPDPCIKIDPYYDTIFLGIVPTGTTKEVHFSGRYLCDISAEPEEFTVAVATVAVLRGRGATDPDVSNNAARAETTATVPPTRTPTATPAATRTPLPESTTPTPTQTGGGGVGECCPEPTPTHDVDTDGISDCCHGTPTPTPTPCATSDTDQDGVSDCTDQCPVHQPGATVDAFGCTAAHAVQLNQSTAVLAAAALPASGGEPVVLPTSGAREDDNWYAVGRWMATSLASMALIVLGGVSLGSGVVILCRVRRIQGVTHYQP